MNALRRVVFGLGLLGLLPVLCPASALAAPGDLLVAEFATGSVVEVSAGGDLSGAPRFATGLTEPLGLCVGPGGDIYVAESGSGEITVITQGGDFTDAEPFAYGPFVPVELWCDETTVLVATPLMPLPLVADVTQGGDLLVTGTFWATGLPAPADMERDSTGTLFSANFDVFDITGGGEFGMAAPFTSGRSITTLTFTGTELWGGEVTAPEIYDLSAGGDLSAASPVVVLPTVGMGHIDGLLTTADGTIMAATGDQLFDISAGGDLSAASPFATGLATGQRGFTGMLEHVCSADADCADTDACNGVEQCVDNRCLPPASPLDCDDADSCTADACDANSGCSHAPIAGCCNEDLDCLIEELCDLEQQRCVPVSVVTTGMEDDTGAETGDATAGTGEPGIDSGSGGDAGADADGDGCGCRSRSATPAPWLFALLLLPYRRLRAPTRRS